MGPSPGAVWCPSAGDFAVAYGSPQLRDGGWTVHGNGGAATKAAYNLVGGFVEFDVTTSAWLSWRLFGSVHSLVSNSSRSIPSLCHRMYRSLFPRVGGVNVITSPTQLCE